jgi:signal transduction histidine kinase
LTSDTHGVSRSVERAAADPATWAVETTMFRALAVLRFVVLVFAITTTLVKWDGLERPGVAGFALAVMTGWTGFTTWAYDEPRRRRPPLLVADLVIAVAMVLLTVVVQSDAQLTGNLSTLPSFWVMAVVLAWGIHWHWVGGLIASAAVSVADIAIRPEITQTNVGNIFLLMVGGPVIGYTTGLLKEMAGARDRAERAAAAAAERARLARVVHDGVLQVLSLVQRRGLELGGEAADLGRLAGEQEVALRALVQQGESSSFGLSGDLARSLSSLQSRTVTVSVPGSVVLFPSAVVEEVTAVVRACLSNVEVHVGPDGPAWVLLEDLGSSVIVTVRDEGPGIPSGRLEDAAAEGRLGVRESIRGRVADLGGTATLVTAPGQGTEWELTFPKA